MLSVRISLLFIFAFLAGCATTAVDYDAQNFPITSDSGIVLKTRLETGLTRSGHSEWISTEDFAKGMNPNYNCGQTHRHVFNGQSWMFDLEDQRAVLNSLNTVLLSNGLLDENASHELVLHLERVTQGPDDKAVYTFEATVSIVHAGNSVYSKSYNVVGNTLSEAFWSTDSWNGAKKRATNHLITEIVADLDENLDNIG